MSGSAAQSNRKGIWSRFHGRLNRAVDDFYYNLGFWVAKHTKATLAIILALVLLCCLGFLNFVVETDGDDLWVPSDSLSKEHEEIIFDYYNSENDFAVIVFESPSGADGNLLTKDAFDKLWEVDAEVWALATDAGNTYADLCVKDLEGACEQPYRGVTRFWNNDFDVYEASVSSDADILAAVNVASYPDGEAVLLEAIFGDSMTLEEDGLLVSAAAMSQSYQIESAREGEAKDESLAWQAEFADLIETRIDSYSDSFTMVFLTGRSYDDALAESVTGEVFLFVTTYIIMVNFVVLMVGRCCAGPVRRRTWLGLAGIMSVLAAGVAAYGINSAFAVPFTALSQVLPFILIGIGVDDMFVIIGSFDHTDPTLEVEERVALAIKRCGVSITYTSLTNVLAFKLGSLAVLPAVEYFCLYAGTAILFDFVLQMTVFVAFLTMDANRQKAGRFDGCCCFTSKRFLEEESIQRGVSLDGETKNGPAKASAHPGVHQLSTLGRWMREKYAPFITSVPGKVLILLATGCLLAAGIYGTTQATQGFEIADLMPHDHYARNYLDVARYYEIGIDTQYVPLNVYTRDVDYADVEVQAQIQQTDILMGGQDKILGPSDSWIMSFVQWAATSAQYSQNVGAHGNSSVYTDRNTFYEALGNFTQDGDNERFLADIVYADDNSTIEISRTEFFLIDISSPDASVDILEDARDVMGESSLDPKPFAFSYIFIFTEQFLVIYSELITNFILALAAVALLSLLVLGRPAIVVLVCLTVAMIDVELLGFVYHWGLEVNSITVIELIMAVGLVVDYMVHIVHYFLQQDPELPKDERIANALGEIGPSVMLGAATTFLGIMPMAFASNFIFQVFFKMFLVIIAFGFYHGVVFVPMALSLLPDRLVASHPAQVAPKKVKMGTEAADIG